MAFQAGKDAKAKLNGSEIGDSATTECVTQITLNRSKDTLETTTIGDDDREFIEGLRTGGFTLNARWEPTASTGIDSIVHTVYNSTSVVSFKFNPTGTATFAAGFPGYTCDVWCESVDIDTPFDDIVTLAASFKVTGAVTRDTSGTY